MYFHHLLTTGPGTERYLLSFVVRDSPTCFVNATCWGSEHFVKDLARTIAIGDIGKITIENEMYQSYNL